MAVIDWEYAFAAPPELVARFPLRLQHFPEEIIPPEKNEQGVIRSARWLEIEEERKIYLTGVEAVEAQQSLPDSPKLSLDLVGGQRQASLLYLMYRWEDKVPWLLTYQNQAVKEGVEKIMDDLRARS